MDSGNSGSISSSGDDEYDSRVDHNHNTLLHHHHHHHHHQHHPSPFLNQFAPSISQPLASSPHFHHSQPSLFDLNPNYLHALSQSQPQIPPSYLNLEPATSSQDRRSEPSYTDIRGGSASATAPNQCLFPPSQAPDTARAALSSSPAGNVSVRGSKKRTRASRRAPTTVLTTDTSNFRAMVQEFTGIPAPPFSSSSSSYSRRLDLLTGASSLRSSNSASSQSHLDTTMSNPFYPLRPSPQKLHHQNPLLLSSTSPSPSTLMLHHNMVDAIASTTTTNNNSSNHNNSSSNININFQQQQHQQQLPHELGLPYPHHMMLNMQNHPSLAFHPSLQQQQQQAFGNNLPTGFGGAKLPSIEDLGMGHGQVNNDGASFVVNDDGGGRREVQLRSLNIGAGGGGCKSNYSGGSASTSLNHEKRALENNDNNNNNNTVTTTRGVGEGTVDSWICSSD